MRASSYWGDWKGKKDEAKEGGAVAIRRGSYFGVGFLGKRKKGASNVD